MYCKRVEQGKLSIPVLTNYLTNMEKHLKKKGEKKRKWCKCGDVEKREGLASCKMDRKLALMTTTLAEASMDEVTY